MKKFIALFCILTFLFANNGLNAQNLLKSVSYNVEEYKIEKVTGKKESHIYPDVTELSVELGEDNFGIEFTKFSFVNAAGEQSFMTWFKDETIHENNIVQRLSMLEGPKSKPTMAYFFTVGRLINNDTSYAMLVAIPDVENGIVHKFTIKADEPYFNQEYLALKIEENSAFKSLRKSLRKVIESDDINKFKGNIGIDNIYETTLDTFIINNKTYKYNYSINEAFYSIPAHNTLSLTIKDLSTWISDTRGNDLLTNDILKIESLIEDLTKGRYVKLYIDDKGKLGDSDIIGSKTREDIYDDIYFVPASEKGNRLHGTTTSHIHIDVRREYGRNTCEIVILQN